MKQQSFGDVLIIICEWSLIKHPNSLLILANLMLNIKREIVLMS